VDASNRVSPTAVSSTAAAQLPEHWHPGGSTARWCAATGVAAIVTLDALAGRASEEGAEMAAMETRMVKAFGLEGDAWPRHANPRSVYTRIPIPA
jgi:hypothetical protein